MKEFFQIEDVKNKKEELELFLKNLNDSNEIEKLKTKVINYGFCPICFSKLETEIIKERVLLIFSNKRMFTFCPKDKSHYNEEDDFEEEE